MQHSALLNVMIAAARKDSYGVADALYAIGRPTKKVDMREFRAEVSMLAEKRLQIRRQQFTKAGCRAADVGLHKYSSTKRIHRSYAPLVCSL